MTAVGQPPALVVFARAPVPGTVKTRLAHVVGTARAAAIYRELVAVTLRHAVAARGAASIGGIELWCTPDAASPYFRDLAIAHGLALHRQVDGDLGERMAAAVAAALQRAPAVLLIGTDCPLLDPAHLAAAAALVGPHDAVVIPAEDGGYVLVGARQPLPFAGVRWSTPHAFADTAAGFARAGIDCALLPPLWDVDEPADLARWDALRNASAA
jgi:rSAM/selenodomain-associated transferase 1